MERLRAKASQKSQREAVIDTTLFSRLIQLEIADYLPFIFKRIRIPREVRREAAKSSGKMKRRLAKKIKEMDTFFVDCDEFDKGVLAILKADLDSGEAAAIAQADYLNSALLIDETVGSERAQLMSIEVIRTGRVLLMLKDAGVLQEVRPFLDRLVKAKFHMSDKVYREILLSAGEERKGR